MSAAKKLKMGIDNLSTIDPEFAAYLKKEDAELLNFDLSDEEDDIGDDEDMQLEEASDAEASSEDEEDEKDEEDKDEYSSDDEEINKGKIKKNVNLIPIDMKMIKTWNGLLNTDLPAALREVSLALRAAVVFNSSKKEEGKGEDKYVVEGIAVYSAVLNTCLLEVVPAVYTFLHIKTPAKILETDATTNATAAADGKAAVNGVEGVATEAAKPDVKLSKKARKKLKQQKKLPQQAQQPLTHLPQQAQLQLEKLAIPTSSKSWKKIKASMKAYLINLLELLELLSSEETLLTLLKHLHPLIVFSPPFPNVNKALIKKLIEFWSQGEEASRLMSFRLLVKVMSYLDDKMLKFTFTNLYLAYVKNSCFTNQQSISFIHFMKQSLVQALSLKPEQAYQSSFYFIQQLGKHLHNALKLQKKQTHQVISNWQFCHSLSLWGAFIGHHPHHARISTLLHPLVEIILATVRMNPSPVYIPLRLFCARILVELSEATGKFIPVLNIIVEPLELPVLQKEPKQTKMKNCLFSCCLRMSKQEVAEKAFLDAVVDEMCELLMQYSLHYSYSIALPELLTPTIVQLKKYMKVSRAGGYKKKLKAVLEKVQQWSEVLQRLRRSEPLDLTHPDAVKRLEDKWSTQGHSNPLKSYYDAFMKIKLKQMEIILCRKDKLSLDDIPRMEKPVKEVKPAATEETRKEFSDLFKFGDDDDDDEDGDDDDDDAERFEVKGNRPKRKAAEVEDDEEEEDDEEDDDDEDDVEIDEDDDDQPDLVEDLKLSEFAADADDNDDDGESVDDDDDDDEVDE